MYRTFQNDKPSYPISKTDVLKSDGYIILESSNPIKMVNNEQLTFSSSTNKCIPFIKNIWKKNSDSISLAVLALTIWAISYSLFQDKVGIQSEIFCITILFISAKVIGVLVSYLKIPPMVGMLLAGVLLRNIQFVEITEFRKLTTVLRQLALVNIMLPAGLGLDPGALIKLRWMVLNLAIVPVAVEVAAITALAYYLLALPWLWGALLGLLLAAVSPAVIIPCLFELQAGGYGVEKGVHTLVIAASTLNDIGCISLFGIVVGVIFSTGTPTMQILQGPIVFALGITFGICWGLLCRWLPHRRETHLVTLRTLLLGAGCVLSALGSDALGYGGAGALGCIVAAFTACLGWRKQGWSGNNPVRDNFVLLWKFFEPISFGLIGIEVNFEILDGSTVLWGTLVMVIALLFRIIASFASTQCSNLNLKENVFVAISWIPKATVQAALGPVALDLARQLNNEELIQYANTVIVVAVMSIIITSPIGAVLIMQLGPRLLHRTKATTEITVENIENYRNSENSENRLEKSVGISNPLGNDAILESEKL